MAIRNVTFDPNTKSGSTLSNGNLTITTTIGGTEGARSTHGKTNGKWYWEVTSDIVGNADLIIGICNPNYTFLWSQSSNHLGYRTDGSTSNGTSNTGVRLNVGSVLGIALDADNKVINFYVNGVLQTTGARNFSSYSEIYPFISSTTRNATMRMTINFGATAFVYNIPSGFHPYNIEFVHKILLSSNNKTYSLTPPVYATETAIPKMTSNTTPSGRAFASSVRNTTEAEWKAFDGTESYYSGAENVVGRVGYLGYEFVNSTVIGKYSVRNRASAIDTPPKNWTFEGSNDGNSWTVLDTRENQIWGITSEDKDFFITPSKINSYKMYRLNWVGNNGSVVTCINELKMYETPLPLLTRLQNQSEQTFINHGIQSPITFAQLNRIKLIESNSISHESGKNFTHAVDLSKRSMDKILFS